MSIQQKCNFGIGIIVTMTDELQEILSNHYDDDLFYYLEQITEEMNFYPIQIQEHSNSDYQFALVYNKTFKHLAKSYERYEQELIDFIKKHKLNVESEFDVVGGVFFY